MASFRSGCAAGQLRAASRRSSLSRLRGRVRVGALSASQQCLAETPPPRPPAASGRGRRCSGERGKRVLQRQTDRTGRQNFVVCGAMTIQQSIPVPPDAAPSAEVAARVTPMMEQFLEIKAAHPGLLLFYRMGDFYELFFEDAEIASRTLGIVLTKRGKHQGLDIPMCGVPVERSEDYLHRLIEAGHRVAVCEQTEDPAAARARGNKSVVRRGVVRLVTPGTLTEDTLLDAKANNYLLAIARARGSVGADRIGLAWIDISTAEFIVTECATGELAATLARINPNEVIVTDALYGDPDLGPLLRELPAVTPLTRDVLRQRHRRAAAVRLFCRRHHGRAQRDVAAGSHGCCRRRDLYRPHPGRKAPAAVAAVARGRRHHHGDRPRHPRQSRTDADAGRRAARLAARCHRLHGDAGRIAAACPKAGGTAHRQRGNCAAARCDRHLRRGQRGARRYQDHAARGTRHVARAGAALGRTRRPARSRRPARRHSGGRCGAGAACAARSTAAGNHWDHGGVAPPVARSRPRIRACARRTTAADQTRRRFCARRL